MKNLIIGEKENKEMKLIKVKDSLSTWKWKVKR